ncbi:MAG: ATP-dependent zinc metalloprotease FtsH, partial [Pseudomonadota bacterium]
MANGAKKPEGPQIPLGPLLLAAMLGVGALILSTTIAPNLAVPAATTIAYTEFKDRVRRGDVASVEVLDDRVVGETAGERVVAYSPPAGDPAFLPLLEDAGVPAVFTPARDGSMLGWLLPFAVIVFFYAWLARRMGGGFGGLPGAGGVLGRKGFRAKSERSEIRFRDVAGQDEAKREVAELVEFLRDPDRFARVGARVPRGVLMMGPPGTGKTLLAKALAGEADVPFYSTTGSAFIEVFVGVGASRVRQMFEEAKKNAPAIVFIDELDSIGRVRGAGLGGGHDEREQTLNQILAELDGFDERVAVVVLAATNRPDVLDPALLRPGRFDRHVSLTLPDKDGRRAILDVHVKDVPLAADADLDAVAAGTPGFSGADLKNLINEAAIDAARGGERTVGSRHLDHARDRVMMGTVRTLAIQPEERRRIAVHEAGHAAVAYDLPNADPLYKVTIIPRGRSLGGTHMLPEEERHTLPQAYLEDQLAIMLAGRAAERVFVGSVSSGADDDIARATKLARSMVARWGMAEEVGPVDLSVSDENPFLGREIARPRSFSEEMAARVDKAVAARLEEAEERALEAIRRRRTGVERLIDALEREETLDA